MPRTEVIFYRETSGRAPVVDWLDRMKLEDRVGFAKCVALVRRLSQEGHALRRPQADSLRDGIRELRVRRGRVNYRILYSFHGQHAALLLHGLTKVDRVPSVDIERARARRRAFLEDPAAHTFEGTVDG